MKKLSKRQTERKEQFYQLTTLVAGNFSLEESLGRLAESAVKILGVKACAIRLLDEKKGKLDMSSTYGLSEEYRNKGPVTRKDVVIKAAFAGEAVVLDDVRVDGRVKYKEAAIKEGLVSQLTVAMKYRETLIGVLRLYSPKPKRFSEEDISVARSVASQCATAITNARLYGRAIEGAHMAEQMRLAAVLQRRMIPAKAPIVAGVDVAAKYLPCFEVGGDFYDFIQINESSFAVAIADVIGKGFPAAIMMSMFRGALRAYTQGCLNGDEIESVVCRLNRMLCEECRDGEFITFFYAIIDIAKMKVTYCNCGHEPALLMRGRVISELDKGGLVLGVEAESDYEIGEVGLEDGDSLLFYTDGLIDAVNFDDEIWGVERLRNTVKEGAGGSAGQMMRNILQYRRRFVGLARQIDDTSVVVVKADRRAKPSFMEDASY